MPFFSVIIPTYNRAAQLDRALNSVLVQSFQDFEVLIMDDGSTDNTREIVSQYSDSRIVYEWAANSGGPARPRNRGIKRAAGTWICFLDADDWWKINKLEVCCKYINEKVDLLYHDLEVKFDKRKLFGKPTIKTRQLLRPVIINLLVDGNAISNSSVVVRKKLLDQINGINENKQMVASEDYNTWLKVAKITDNFIYIPETLGFYMYHSQGISRRNMALCERSAVEEFLFLLDPDQRVSIEIRLRYTCGRYNYKIGNLQIAKSDLLYCLKYWKRIPKIKTLWMLFMLWIKQFCYIK
jgi:glycosyltransferase involved in cell wall biosynthesis